MKNSLKKIVSAVLAVGMIAGAVSVAASAEGTAQGKMLKVDIDSSTGTGEGYGYINLTPSVDCQEGDYLEYDVYLTEAVKGVGGVDVCVSNSTYCRDDRKTYIDENRIPGHPDNDLSSYATEKWYSRKLPLLADVISGAKIVLAFENNGAVTKTTVYYDNIRITRNDEIVGYAFKDGGSEYSYDGSEYGDTNYEALTVSVVDASTLPVINHADEIEVAKNAINELPNPVSSGAMADYDKYARAVTAYDNLTLDDAAASDISADTVAAVKAKLTEFDEQKAAEDQKAADAVIAEIEALPETVELTDEEKVNSALNNYNALTDVQKKLVTNYSKLNSAVNMIEALKIMPDEIKKVQAKIDAIAALGYDQLDDSNVKKYKRTVRAARSAYDKFESIYGEGKMDISDLLAAEAKLNIYENGGMYGDIDGNGKVEVPDALKVLQAAVGKLELTDAQKALADVDGVAGIGVSDALQVLQKAVGKIDKFAVEK